MINSAIRIVHRQTGMPTRDTVGDGDAGIGLPAIEVGIIHRRAGIPPLGRPVPLHRGDRGEVVARDALAGIPRAIEHAHEQPSGRFVHLSSTSVDGGVTRAGRSLDEEASVPQPETAYAVTKYVAERLILRSGTQRGGPVTVARLGSVSGASSTTRAFGTR